LGRFVYRQGQEIFPFVQTGSGAYPASYPKGTGAKLPERVADHSLPSSYEFNYTWSLPPVLIRLHVVVATLAKLNSTKCIKETGGIDPRMVRIRVFSSGYAA